MNKLLSIIIPCFNEKNTIKEVVKKIINIRAIKKEIIIVDDGSIDGTTEILKSLEKDIIKVIYLKENHGKGFAIKEALPFCNGELILIQDADLEYDPLEYRDLIAPLVSGKADVVFSTRFKGSKPHKILYFWHYFGNKIITFISNIFTNLNLSDIESGYKVFRKEIIKNIEIKEKGFGIEPELVAKISKLGCRIYEVGISYNGRSYSEGKKIRWKDGIRALWCIIKYNLFN